MKEPQFKIGDRVTVIASVISGPVEGKQYLEGETGTILAYNYVEPDFGKDDGVTLGIGGAFIRSSVYIYQIKMDEPDKRVSDGPIDGWVPYYTTTRVEICFREDELVLTSGDNMPKKKVKKSKASVKSTKTKAKKKSKKSKKSKKPDPWGEAYDVLCGLVKKRMKKAGYKEFYVTYSVLRHKENDKARAPIDNLDEIAFEGKGRITYQGFGENRYTGDELDSPTWFELCIEAEKAIRFTDDHHHIFFEGVEKKEEGSYELFMGS